MKEKIRYSMEQNCQKFKEGLEKKIHLVFKFQKNVEGCDKAVINISNDTLVQHPFSQF